MPWKHRRNEIRGKLTALLKAGVDVGQRVFPERFDPLFIPEMPCICYYFENEPVDDDKARPIRKKRRLTVNIDIIRRIGQEDGLESWLDERAAEVEQVFDNNKYLDFNYVSDTFLTNTSWGSIDVSAEEHVRALRLTYQINYETEIQPTSSLDEFKKAPTDYVTPEGAEARDDIVIRT